MHKFLALLLVGWLTYMLTCKNLPKPPETGINIVLVTLKYIDFILAATQIIDYNFIHFHKEVSYRNPK